MSENLQEREKKNEKVLIHRTKLQLRLVDDMELILIPGDQNVIINKPPLVS